MSFTYSPLPSHAILTRLDELTDVLIDCVEGGASVSFMLPLSRERAAGFWQQVALDIAAATRTLLVCEDAQGRIVGTVQLVTGQPDNQPHRADVSKLLVHRRARRQGIAQALMEQLEEAARAAGKTLLVLDTATGSGAETFYRQAGWQLCGDIPGYALMPDGKPCGTTIFYKTL